jgi:hypothetical protein
VIARSEELTDTYLLVNGDLPIVTPDTMGSANPHLRSDIVFLETANGGAVLAFSSIAWCDSLAHNGYDNNVSRLTGNVLRRFASTSPSDQPAPTPATAEGGCAKTLWGGHDPTVARAVQSTPGTAPGRAEPRLAWAMALIVAAAAPSAMATSRRPEKECHERGAWRREQSGANRSP